MLHLNNRKLIDAWLSMFSQCSVENSSVLSNHLKELSDLLSCILWGSLSWEVKLKFMWRIYLPFFFSSRNSWPNDDIRANSLIHSKTLFWRWIQCSSCVLLLVNLTGDHIMRVIFFIFQLLWEDFCLMSHCSWLAVMGVERLTNDVIFAFLKNCFVCMKRRRTIQVIKR